jgi:hypothetical protein
MMATLIILALMLVSGGMMFAFLLIGHWHTCESDYWSNVALIVTLDPARDAYYRPLLEWAKANEPSVLTRLKAWRSPEERRRAWVWGQES